MITFVATMVVSLAMLATPARADRFGPPLMERVIAGGTTLDAAADRSQPIGPLAHDAVVVVLGQESDMVQVPESWVPTADVGELTDPWVAEVSDPSASVHAYPMATPKSGARACRGSFCELRESHTVLPTMTTSGGLRRRLRRSTGN
jgi:hypothetical protein